MSTQAESPPSLTVACLLLAAGASRRMGQDKLSLPLGSGATVLEQAALHLSRAPVSQHILVLRDRSHIRFDAESLNYQVLEIGDEAALGMHRSLKLGLSLLAPEIQAVMVCLGDQPFVRAEDYSSLLLAYEEGLARGRPLLYPTLQGKRGNPAVIHRQFFAEILNETDRDGGCRYLFERYPELVNAWEASSPSFFRDLDTPEEYRACLN